MSRANSNNRTRETFEWQSGIIANIGTTATAPYDIIFHYIKDKKISDIIDLFFNNKTTQINLLDQCVLEQFWWTNKDIVKARYSQINHPTHYSGEYIFDKINNERTILTIRQPDIDGKHWKAEHIHIKRGHIDLQDIHKITKPTFDEHIELTNSKINGVYVIKIQ